MHIYHGGMDVPTPLIQGHEFVGTVAQVGKNVTTFTVGQRVVAEHVVSCGHCRYCLSGQQNLCLTPSVIGLQRPGALAEYLSLPAHLCYALPPELDDDAGVLVEPLSIAVYAVRKAGVTVGDSVAVIGQGPIGLFLDQVAGAAGATVYGFDPQPDRLAFAQDHTFIEHGWDPTEGDVSEAVSGYTHQDGVDIVFEAVGRPETLDLSLQLARRGGKVLLLGVFEKPAPTRIMDVVKRELILQGSWTCLHAFEPTIELLRSGKISTAGLITHRYPFAEADRAFQEAAAGGNRIKTVIEFS
jgi:2-desacetyl-2-hydroxyethyl bacteriochlorophyllide A dehydrogenase